MRLGERPFPLEFRLGWLGIASAALDLGTVTIKTPAWRTGVTAGDWIEMASTYLLVGLYAWVAVGVTGPAGGERAVSGDARPRRWVFPLLFLSAITFVLGHGVHVSANSIHDMLARGGLGDPEKLVIWWDERFGHDLIDVAKLGLCAGLTALERSVPRPPRVFGASGAARILFMLGVLA